MIHLAQEERNKTFTNDNTMRWDSGEVRRREAPPRQRKHPRKPPKRKGTGAGYYVTILVISAILAGVGWLMCNDLLALNKKDHSAEIVVTDGEKLGSVSKSLKKEGLINYRGLFLLYSSLSDTEVVAGTYELNTSMDYHALLTAMSARSGARKTVNVTIPEGYSMQQIFELLEEKNVNTVEALTEAAANEDYDYDFLANKEKGDASRLEGYLFPDTYQFYSGGDAKTVIDKMLRNFDNNGFGLHNGRDHHHCVSDREGNRRQRRHKNFFGHPQPVEEFRRNSGLSADRCGTALRAGRAQRGADRCRQGDRQSL